MELIFKNPEIFDEMGDKLGPAVKIGMERGVKVAEGNVRKWVGPGGKSQLHVRTGQLLNSIMSDVEATKDEVTGIIGSRGLPYPSAHEYGPTTITGNPWLTIPLEAAKTARGVTRGPARSFENTFFQKSKKGNLILFQKKGKKGIVPLFVLKRSVTIKRRAFVKPGTLEVLPIIGQHIAHAVAEAL